MPYKPHKDHKNPDLVFVNFNAMDFVFGSSIPLFEQNIRKTLERLTSRFPQSTIVVTPLVDVVSLMLSAESAVTLPPRLEFPGFTCAQSYKKIGFDKALGLNANTTPAEIEEKRAKFASMQQTLDTEVDFLKEHRASVSYENFSGKVIKIEAGEPPEGQWPAYLSADCLHPNVAGQMVISNRIWRALQAEYL